MERVPGSGRFVSRIGRPIFVLLHLCLTALLYRLLIVALVLVLGPCPPSSAPPSTWEILTLGSMAAALMCGRLWLEIKRLHDLGWSGWWAVVSLAIAIATVSVHAAHGVLATLPGATMLAWFLLLALKPGTAGDNDFGPPPTSGFRLFGPGRAAHD